jgi:hypothetical protein
MNTAEIIITAQLSMAVILSSINLYRFIQTRRKIKKDYDRLYRERQGYTYTGSGNIVWSETYARYMTFSEYRELVEQEENKIDIKPKKTKIRHNFTGLPWE